MVSHMFKSRKTYLALYRAASAVPLGVLRKQTERISCVFALILLANDAHSPSLFNVVMINLFNFSPEYYFEMIINLLNICYFIFAVIFIRF